MENKNLKDYISIGKITNFFGIKGEAKVGFDNENQIKNAKKVLLLDDKSQRTLTIKNLRFHKNSVPAPFRSPQGIASLQLPNSSNFPSPHEQLPKTLFSYTCPLYLIIPFQNIVIFYSVISAVSPLIAYRIMVSSWLASSSGTPAFPALSRREFQFSSPR